MDRLCRAGPGQRVLLCPGEPSTKNRHHLSGGEYTLSTSRASVSDPGQRRDASHPGCALLIGPGTQGLEAVFLCVPCWAGTEAFVSRGDVEWAWLLPSHTDVEFFR